MPNLFQIQLNSRDLNQLLDRLAIRAEAWEKTAAYLRTEQMPEGELFIIEECRDAEEADQIAAHYRSIIQNIRQQMEEQGR